MTKDSPEKIPVAAKQSVEAHLLEIKKKIDDLEKDKPSKLFIAVTVAVLGGLFSIAGILLESKLSAEDALKDKVAEKVAERTADFYLEVPVELGVASTLFSEFCAFQSFSRNAEINDVLAKIHSRVSAAPEPVDQALVAKLREYGNLLASGLVRPSEKMEACAKEKVLHQDLLEAVRKAIKDLR